MHGGCCPRHSQETLHLRCPCSCHTQTLPAFLSVCIATHPPTHSHTPQAVDDFNRGMHDTKNGECKVCPGAEQECARCASISGRCLECYDPIGYKPSGTKCVKK